jgi:hypothetical protein
MVSMVNGMSGKFGPASGIQAANAPASTVGATAGSAAASSVAAALGNSGGGTYSGPGPVTILIGVLGLWVVFKILGEHPDAKLSLGHIHLGAYNVATILLTTIGGIAFIKLVLNKWQVPGLAGATDLINFV